MLYAGRLTREKGIDRLADAFLAARERDPRLHLVLAGGGPEEAELRARLGEQRRSSAGSRARRWPRSTRARTRSCSPARPTRSGRWCSRRRRAGCRSSRSAGADRASLIADGESGLLAGPEPAALAEALLSVIASPLLRERLRRGGLQAVRERTWERSMERLAAGYRTALRDGAAAGAREVA